MGGGRGGTSRILLPPSSSSSPSSETQTKHFIPWQKRSVCHPRFRDACEQYHEHEKGGGKEGRSGRREDEEESVWILHRGLNVLLRDNRCSTPPLLFFSLTAVSAHATRKNSFLSRQRCQNRTGGRKVLFIEEEGSLLFPSPPSPLQRYRRYPSSNKIPP